MRAALFPTRAVAISLRLTVKSSTKGIKPLMKTCLICNSPLPAQARGRPRKYCPSCGPTPTPEQRQRKRAQERERYAADPEFRARTLAARHRRYAGNVERERERARRYYSESRERVLARIKARQGAARGAT